MSSEPEAPSRSLGDEDEDERGGRQTREHNNWRKSMNAPEAIWTRLPARLGLAWSARAQFQQVLPANRLLAN